MAQSYNTKVEITCKATAYLGVAKYGNVMLGDKAFEFYKDNNPEDHIQIPWEEVHYVAASVMFKKWINRFVIFTNKNGHYSFSTRKNKEVLRIVRNHIGSEKMVRSPSFIQVVKNGIGSIIKRKK